MYNAIFEWDEPEGSRMYNILRKFETRGSLNSIKQKSELTVPRITVHAPFARENSLGVEVIVPIIEDFSYEVKSNFENMSDAISSISGTLGSIINLFQSLNKLGAVGSGQSNDGAEWMNFQVWQNTEPFRMSFKGMLETRNNPYMDVYLPSVALLSQTMFSVVESNGKRRYFTPGINMRELNRIKEERKKTQGTSARTQAPKAGTTDSASVNTQNEDTNAFQEQMNKGSAKLLRSFKISTFDQFNKRIDLVSVDGCFIETAKPNWSKDQTESGFPLWSEMELTVQSIHSANDTMFKFEQPVLEEADQSFGATARRVGGKIANNVFR